ncbi:MAG TPA: hypothetical protein VFT22_38390 [Kofleriaceae bacterium]|nr:hypothetical protein [Kofleriaceae bacterium]
MPQIESPSTPPRVESPTAPPPSPPSPPSAPGGRAPDPDARSTSGSGAAVTTYRAKLARAGYAYLRPFAEPLLAQLEASPSEQDRPKLLVRLEAMFAVSHSPDGFGLTDVKAASNRYHGELGARVIAAFRTEAPGPDAASSRARAEARARGLERELDPLLEDGVHLGVQLASTEDAERTGSVEATITIAPNMWFWIGVVLAIGAMGGAMVLDALDPPLETMPELAPEPPRGRTALDRKGKARGAASPDSVLEHAHASVGTCTRLALGPSATATLGNKEEYTITPDQRAPFRIKLVACPLGERVYRAVVNPSKVCILQISHAATRPDIERAVAAGIAETAELVRVINGGEIPVDQDLLRPSGSLDEATLSPRDLAALAQLEVLAERLQGKRDRKRDPVCADIHVLIDDLGLRATTQGARHRRDLIEQRLSPRARACVRDLGASDGTLTGGLKRSFDLAQHEEARALEQDEARDEREAPLHQTPRQGRKISREQVNTLAARARARRNAKSERMVEKYTALAQQVLPPALHMVNDPQIGGGAALAAVRPNQLLIDDAGRWQRDESEDLAQTAGELRWVRDAGLGDPMEFVDAPNERVPVAAIRYWEDMIALQADVINGRAAVQVNPQGVLVMTVTPAVGAQFRVGVNGTPMVSTGFPPETCPKPRDPSPAAAKQRLLTALASIPLSHSPAANLTRVALRALDPTDEPAVSVFVNAADPVIIGAMRNADAAAMAVFDACVVWTARHVAGPQPRVLTGDEANGPSLDPLATDDWVITGVGGTGISAAEIILDKNPRARVTMYGSTPTAGLFDNVQARGIMARNGPTGDGRFQVITGQQVGTLTTPDGGATFNVGAVTAQRHLNAPLPLPIAAPNLAPRRWLVDPDPALLPSVEGLLQADVAAEANYHGDEPYGRVLITIVGANIPPNLRNDPSFARLLATYGPVCGTLRLQVATGGFAGAVAPSGPGVTTGVLTTSGYIAAIGRRGQSSPVIRALIADAIRDGHEVDPELRFDDNGSYIGYRITITAPNAAPVSVDVVGAASRFLPMPPFQEREQQEVTRAGAIDAPPESGNFDGGFSATALQAQAYARQRRSDQV